MFIVPVWVLTWFITLVFGFGIALDALCVSLCVLQGCPGQFQAAGRRPVDRCFVRLTFLFVPDECRSTGVASGWAGRRDPSAGRSAGRPALILFFFFVPFPTFPGLIVYVWDPLWYAPKISDFVFNARGFN